MVEILSSRIVAKNPWTTIVSEETLLPSGRRGEYLIVERLPAIMIIPLLEENGSIYTYLVRQQRHPIGKEAWQFPMGTLSQSEDPTHCATHELEEEAGIRAQKYTQVGEYFVDPGLSRQKCIVFIAEDLKMAKQQLEETEEGMIVKRFSISQLKAMAKKGEIEDSWGFAGLFFLSSYLEEK